MSTSGRLYTIIFLRWVVLVVALGCIRLRWIALGCVGLCRLVSVAFGGVLCVGCVGLGWVYWGWVPLALLP